MRLFYCALLRDYLYNHNTWAGGGAGASGATGAASVGVPVCAPLAVAPDVDDDATVTFSRPGIEPI